MKVTEGIVTSRFGMRVHPVTKVRKMHNGIDIAAPIGTPVYCPDNGRVSLIGLSLSAGNFIHINCGELTFIFMHLSMQLVRKGEMVKKGQQIGLVGNTGVSTAPHLHFEVRKNNTPIDPETYIEF